MRQILRALPVALGLTVWINGIAFAQGFSTSVRFPYRIVPNVTYLTANNFEAKLDVYSRSDVTTPQPTLIWIHGGGWTGGAKETAIFSLLPYMEMGWNVVNVEYRLAKVSLAPAAVEDCLCAAVQPCGRRHHRRRQGEMAARRSAGHDQLGRTSKLYCLALRITAWQPAEP